MACFLLAILAGMHSREQHALLPPEVIAGYQATFITRTDRYPQQRPDGRFLSVPQPITPALIAAHLYRHLTLGAYALSKESLAQWVCLDADTYDGWLGLLALADMLLGQRVTAYLEPSRRGGHLWLFCSPLPGSFARRFAHQLLRDHALTGIEVFPKQDYLTTGSGSLVRLPLGVHRKTGKVYPFVTPDRQPLAPTIREQVALLASPERVPLPFVLAALARSPAPTLEPSKPTSTFRRAQPDTQMSLSERLKGTISVLDFVSCYVELDGHHTGFCPFHDDQHKSFAVDVEHNYWHCFAGCKGQTIIDFWMQWRAKHGQDGSFTAAIKDLRAMLL
jgi:hypothetical protein